MEDETEKREVTTVFPAERANLLALLFGADEEEFDLYSYEAVTVVKDVVACAAHRFTADFDNDGAWQKALQDAQTLFEAVGYAAVNAWKWHAIGGKSFGRVGHFDADEGEPARFIFAPDVIAPPGPPSRKLSKPQVEATLDSLMTRGAVDAVKTMREVAPAFFADVDAKTVDAGNPSFDEFIKTQDGNVRQAFEDGTYERILENWVSDDENDPKEATDDEAERQDAARRGHAPNCPTCDSGAFCAEHCIF